MQSVMVFHENAIRVVKDISFRMLISVFGLRLSMSKRLAIVLRDEARTVRTCLAQVNAMIAEMEANDDQMEVYDSLMCLRDSRRIANDKLVGLNDMIAEAEEEINTYEAH
nr:hypothetical protein [Tanacetum cinerariifolium]